MAGKARRVVWTLQAGAGLDDALENIAEDSWDAAEKVLEVVLGVAGSLQFLAERGRMVPEFGEEATREVFVYRHHLIYEVKESEVRILAFLRGARDFDHWWREVANSS